MMMLVLKHIEDETRKTNRAPRIDYKHFPTGRG